MIRVTIHTDHGHGEAQDDAATHVAPLIDAFVGAAVAAGYHRLAVLQAMADLVDAEEEDE